MYATPNDYTARFGLTEATQMLADEERLLTSDLLRQAVIVQAGGAWGGTATPAEQAAADAAAARLQRELELASSLMDSYLRTAVALPLAPDAALAGTLQDCCLALARCGLADDCDNATERMDKTCERWRAWLRDVAAGKVHLVAADGSTAERTAGVRTGQAASAINWGSYGGVR